jgi:hypothetical protein
VKLQRKWGEDYSYVRFNSCKPDDYEDAKPENKVGFPEDLVTNSVKYSTDIQAELSNHLLRFKSFARYFRYSHNLMH